MNKLNTSQWIAFAFAAIGLIVTQLEQFGVTAQIIAGISSVSGTLKLLWDLYKSFTAKQAEETAKAFAKFYIESDDSMKLRHAKDVDVAYKEWSLKLFR